MNPKDAAAHTNLGRLLQDQYHVYEAEAHYRQALVIQPEDATAALSLGLMLEKLGRRQAAIEAYQRALKIDPNFVEAHYNLKSVRRYRPSIGLASSDLIEWKAARIQFAAEWFDAALVEQV